MANKTKDPREETVRARSVRDMEQTSRASYRFADSLDIPENISKFYEEQGFRLYWVRCIDPKTRTFDTARISQKMSVGGAVVTPQEIKLIDPTFLLNGASRFQFSDEFGFGEEDQRTTYTGIRKSDVVLMKIPIEWDNERRAYKNNQASEALDAQPRRIKADGGIIESLKFGTDKIKLKKGESFFE